MPLIGVLESLLNLVRGLLCCSLCALAHDLSLPLDRSNAGVKCVAAHLLGELQHVDLRGDEVVQATGGVVNGASQRLMLCLSGLLALVQDSVELILGCLQPF